MGAGAAVLSVAGVVTAMVSRLARISWMDARSSAQGSNGQTAGAGVLDDGVTEMESSLAKTTMSTDEQYRDATVPGTVHAGTPQWWLGLGAGKRRLGFLVAVLFT